MNTIGKILVILNFLFAVIVGIFLVVTLAMGTRWQDAHKKLTVQVNVLAAQRDSHAKLNEKLANDLKEARGNEQKAIQDLKDKQSDYDAQESVYKVKTKELENRALDADLALQQSLKTQDRLTKEITHLNKSISDRETLIITLQADLKSMNNTARNYESIARARQIQNENLLEQLREMTQKLARIEAGVGPDVTAVRNPNDPNPPAVTVDGRIEKVHDTDSSLVQVTLGTDHGVNKNHTLYVYRTRPEPTYLGMIRIVDAYHQKSVGRLVHTGTGPRPQLRPDDMVTSKITR